MISSIIEFEKIKDLKFSSANEVFAIHAASGLVKYKENFYVISDDERSLFKFSLEDSFCQKIELQSGTLPSDPVERKKLKPDWESLIYFPQQLGLEGILVTPSGSKLNRQTGYFLNLKESNQKPSVQEVDFSKLYKRLQKEFSELNIEGGVVMNSTLKLLQRGNGRLNQNAVIDLDLIGLLEDLKTSQDLSPERVLKINPINLGTLEEVPLSFTDAFAIDGFLYFLAVAENTNSTYEDGQFMGAILGQINSQGKVCSTWKIKCSEKPEGLWMEQSKNQYKVYLVTDADSRLQISALYQGILDLNPT